MIIGGTCYLCGQRGAHLVNCPKNKKTEPKKTPPVQDSYLVPQDDADYMIGIPEPAPRSRILKPPTYQKKKAFISLTTDNVPSYVAQPSVWLKQQPQVPSKPYRLWVDDACASCFLLLNAFIGVAENLNACGAYDLKGIPASMFRTGRWPLPPEPDKDLEWGIDLSSWKTIDVSQYFTLEVKNITGGIQPFRAALEVWTIV